MLLFVAAVPVIYNKELSRAKIAAGNIKYSKATFTSGKIIKVEGISDLTIFQYDSLVVESLLPVRKNFEIIEEKDTLIIRGLKQSRILLYVPADHHVVAFNSRILLRGHLRYLHPPSITLSLADSELKSDFVSRDKHVSQHLDYLTITNLGNSSVDLRGSLEVVHLVLNEVNDFKCAPEVGISETDFSFAPDSSLRLTACAEGRFIGSR
jgi:hypothetical protein